MVRKNVELPRDSAHAQFACKLNNSNEKKNKKQSIRLTQIDRIVKWRLSNYSFAFILIILTRLVSTNEIQ